MKWYPGHYTQVLGDVHVNGYSMKQAYDEMNVVNSGLVGIQLRLSWSDLESSLGNYQSGFDIIDEHLNKLSLTNKKLFLFIAHKWGAVPTYLTTDPMYEGGVYNFTSANDATADPATNIKLWNIHVRQRFEALIEALGARYNTNPDFAGVALPETAFGEPTPAGSVTADEEDSYYDALLLVNQKLRENFPNTVTTQFTNYPRKILSQFIENLQSMGAGLGGPDVWLDDPGVNGVNTPNQADGVYSYYAKLSGVVPLTPSVMSGDYERTIADATNPANRTPTVEELLDFARDRLKANIIFWTRDTKAPDNHYQTVLALLKNLTQTGDPRAKLDERCPTQFSQCTKN